MHEEFLHYIWKYQLLEHSLLRTVKGETIEVINPGFHNTDAGPDFFNSKIRIGKTMWVGNVEIHVRSSDWVRHNHSSDEAYNNVILHVVYKDDTEIYDQNERLLPTVQIINKFPASLQKNYTQLIKSKAWVPCASSFSAVAQDQFFMNSYLERILISRMESKSAWIIDSLQYTSNNWEEAFYWSLARSFGFKTNAEPFELLARSLPLTIINKHRASRFQLEALLFGQAGFLHSEMHDHYGQHLFSEYEFLRKKYALEQYARQRWKFLRLRPVNFPTMRISQFAHLLSTSNHLFHIVREFKTVEDLHEIFKVEASAYWDDHYNFDKRVAKSMKKVLGVVARDSILINSITLFLFVYGQQNNRQQFKDSSLNLLESIPAENNAVVSNWEHLGYKATSAFYSQALIELKTEYCTRKKCLSCGIGNRILKNR